ncbi:hypothetical protein [Haladaptatus litoreus]|nr:hypothetical protein [Haladaptatus litoreus]
MTAEYEAETVRYAYLGDGIVVRDFETMPRNRTREDAALERLAYGER